MNRTYTLFELRRVFRDPVTLFFVAGLPAFLYLIFGASQDYSDIALRHGNVAMSILVGMAAYGAVTATTGVGGMAAVERMQGWGRQLGLTPLTDAGFVATKAFVAAVVAAIPISLIYLLGAFTGASGTTGAWTLSAVVLLVGAVTWSLFGLAVGTAFRSEAAVSAASGSLVIFAFLGNLFFPLSGRLLDVAAFTPLYGYAALARYPINEGYLTDSAGTEVAPDPLWALLLNVGVWTVVFAATAVWLVRRGRARQ